MPSLGLPELLIIAVILILVFGVGKLGDVGGALGRGIREFKHEVNTSKEETPKLEEGPDRKTL